MKCARLGGPDVLVTGKRDVPQPRADEVLIKVTAAGVNGPDLVQRRGPLPPAKGASDLLGLEVSGEIVAIGAAQTQWAVGDHVCALTNGGGYAEYVAVTASHCLPIPAHMSEMDAAGLPETYFTVWSNVFLSAANQTRWYFSCSWWCWRHWLDAIQLGAAMGLQVFTTADSDESCAYCEALGAKQQINYKQDDFVPILREAGGADIILDIIGGDYVARNIKAAHADARIIQLAFNLGSKMEIDLMPVMLKRLTLTGSTLRSRPRGF